MKYYWILLIVISSYAQEQKFKLHVDHSDKIIKLYVDNYQYCPVTLNLSYKLQNLRLLKPDDTSYFIHFALFFILYFILYFAFLNQYKILIFCIIYAIFIEIFQIFNSRGFQINDIIFNIIGFTVSFIFLYSLFIFINKK